LPWTILFNADILHEEVMEMGFSVTRRKVGGC
jgi:hypothetical protein